MASSLTWKFTTQQRNTIFSDEVQGVTIDFDYRDLHNPRRATPISARLAKAILAEHYDSISEQLADGDV